MRAAIFNRAGMIDRPDRDIETGTAGTGRDRQADGDGEHERPLPNPSRPRCVPHLETSARRRKLLGCQCRHLHLHVLVDHQAINSAGEHVGVTIACLKFILVICPMSELH
jgi:hypothetical protein